MAIAQAELAKRIERRRSLDWLAEAAERMPCAESMQHANAHVIGTS
jgi:hypothetical protein